MPERSFGRTVRYRRTKLGLSQAKLGDLVGRSTATIRSWERDKTRPTDEKVLAALAAILGVDERQLFEKADVETPGNVESSPTVEQALATLSIDEGKRHRHVAASSGPEVDRATRPAVSGLDPDVTGAAGLGIDETVDATTNEAPRPVSVPPTPPPMSVVESGDADVEGPPSARLASGSGIESPAYVAPPDPYVQTPLTPTLADLSYVEDASQRQLYRLRTLATMVALVALVLAFVWAVGEGLGALGDWWDEFFGDLRL